ncbi:MAG: carboxypeptidase-like regulatory domain-containing protein, partial [Flavobacteriales bacterium]
MRIRLAIILFLAFFCSTITQAQDRKIIQFSGVVVSGDSLQPVPYTSIMVRNSFHGTMSDFYGFFSFVALAKDTIEFAAVGYQRSTFVIPDDLNENRYSLIQMMQKDTFLLKETVIFPWPTREQFKEAFLRIEVPDDDLERARKNLAQES